MKRDLVISCFQCSIPRVLDIFGEKMKILKLTTKKVAVPLIFVSASLWF